MDLAVVRVNRRLCRNDEHAWQHSLFLLISDDKMNSQELNLTVGTEIPDRQQSVL